MTTNIDIATVTNGSTSGDTISMTGRVVKLIGLGRVMKYDATTQEKLEKVFRTAVISDRTDAVLVMLWEDLAKNVRVHLWMMVDVFMF